MLKFVVAPALMVIVIGGIALLSVVAQQAWLAPSIAAAAFTQLFNPLQPGARPYSIVLGQIVGALSGFAGVRGMRGVDAGAMRLVVGIVLVAVLGEIARRILIRVEPKDQLTPSPPA